MGSRVVGFTMCFVVVVSYGVPASASAHRAPASIEVSVASWKLPAPLSREVVLTDGNALLLFGGQDAGHNSTASSWRIDPATGAVTALASLVPPVHDAAGARVRGENLIIAGGTPPSRSDTQVVPPRGAATTRGALPAVRTDHVAARIGSTVYVLGGAQDEGLPVASVFASSDAGATWHDAGTLAEPARYPAVAVVDHAIYLFGGVTTATGADTTSVQRYDPKTKTTRVVAHLPAPLSHATAIVFGGVVFVVGGFVGNVPSSQILRFNVRRGKVSTAGSLPGPLTDAAGVVVGAVGYVVGGEQPGRATTAAVETLKPR